MNPPDLLSQMADIKGVDGISIFPLAYGWWIVLALVSVLLAIAFFLYYRHVAYEASWRGEAKRALFILEQDCGRRDGKAIASDLSSLLRRIAMQLHSRKACAGLEGQDWLRFLKTHDPKGFDWQSEGGPLLTLPYAPPSSYPSEKIKTLIEASRSWIAK